MRRKLLAGRTSKPCSRRGLSSMETTIRRHVTIDGIDQPYLVGLNLKLLLAHQLRNTHCLPLFTGKLPHHIEAVARTCEVQYHPLLPLFNAGGEDGSTRCGHHCGQCRTSHNLESRTTCHIFLFHHTMYLISTAKILGCLFHKRMSCILRFFSILLPYLQRYICQ